MIGKIRSLIRKKTFRTILISYIFVLLIPVVISMIVYSTAISTVNKQVADMSRLSAIQLQTQNDAILTRVMTSASALALDTNLRMLIDTREDADPSVRYQINRFSESLGEYEQNSTLIENAYVYFIRANILLASDFRYHSDIINSMTEKRFGMSAQDLKYLIQGKIHTQVVLKRAAGGSGDNELLIMQPVLDAIDYTVGGVVIMTINADQLAALSKNMVFASGSTFLISPEKDYFISTKGSGAINWNDPDTDRLISDLMGYEVHTAVSESSVSRLTYATAISVNEYYRPIRNIIGFVAGYVLLCLVFGAVATFVSARRRYTPIEQMLQFLSAKPEGGEFQAIEQALREASAKDKLYERQLAEQSEAARENMLAGLLKNRAAEPEYLDGMLALHKVEIPGSLFAAVTFYIDNYSNLYFGKEKMDEEERIRLTAIILRSIVEELLSPFAKAYVIRVDSAFACIVCFRKEPQDKSTAETRLKDALSQAVGFIEENFGLSILAAVGTVVGMLYDLPASYTRALDAVEYATLLNVAERCIVYSESVPSTGKVCGGFLEKKRRLFNLLVDGRYVDAACVIDDMIDAGLISPELGFSAIKRRLHMIVNLLCEHFYSISETLDEDARTQMNPEQRFAAVHNAQELRKIAREYLESLVAFTAEEDKLSDHLGCKIRVFIDGNIKNPDLDITYISDHLKLSQSYVSRVFKRQIGVTVLEYINDKRIREAKRLLTTTKRSIKEISEEVGYRNPWTLTRTLRRIEGLPPVAYRDTLED